LGKLNLVKNHIIHNGGFVLGSSHFLLLPRLPKKTLRASKVVKISQKFNTTLSVVNLKNLFNVKVQKTNHCKRENPKELCIEYIIDLGKFTLLSRFLDKTHESKDNNAIFEKMDLPYFKFKNRSFWLSKCKEIVASVQKFRSKDKEIINSLLLPDLIPIL
jgi:hypothetical protein